MQTSIIFVSKYLFVKIKLHKFLISSFTSLFGKMLQWKRQWLGYWRKQRGQHFTVMIIIVINFNLNFEYRNSRSIWNILMTHTLLLFYLLSSLLCIYHGYSFLLFSLKLVSYIRTPFNFVKNSLCTILDKLAPRT